MADWVARRFLDEPIEAVTLGEPGLTKKPAAPSAFRWRGEEHRVQDVLLEWFDYRRRGRMARNMSPAHAQTAERRGSWGVGRFYFRVKLADGRVYDVYYDRSPESSDDRGGHWFVWREMASAPDPSS